MRKTITFIVIVILAIAAIYFLYSSKRLAPRVPSSALSSLEEELSQCHSFPTNSTQTVTETSRVFINLPKQLFPENITSYFVPISGTPTAGYVSNGGLPGHGLEENSNCWSTYIEFNGKGTITLDVPTSFGEYKVQFIVVQNT